MSASIWRRSAFHSQGLLGQQPLWRLVAAMVVALAFPAQAEQPAVAVTGDGRLAYAQDGRGNQIVDFSHCGYAGSDRSIPRPPVRVVVSPGAGDDLAPIQAALDYVAALPIGDDGLRGAVRLAAGEFQVSGQIRINASGVVLQGSGAMAQGTVIRATGVDRRALISVAGTASPVLLDQPAGIAVADDYVPVGSRELLLQDARSLAVGDQVFVTRPSTAAWIESVGGVGWKPGTRDLRWDRVVTAINGNRITLDGPLTTALDAQYGGGTVSRYRWPDRVSEVGVEDVVLVSDCDQDRPLDEDHAWYGVVIDRVSDAWIRRVVFRHFAGGAVHLGAETKSILVEDCISEAPVSEVGGYRRHTYFTLGQTALFHRCWSESGRHDFSVGHCAAGPNAFVECRAKNALGESGPIESWASGVLYDNVRIDGNDLSLENRWNSPPKTHWAAANSVLWQCRASTARCFSPPGATNWAIGVWATPAGDGVWEGHSDFVEPLSLFQAQLEARRGVAAAEPYVPLLGRPLGATSPTYDEAARFAADSLKPGQTLLHQIRRNLAAAVETFRSPASPPSAEPIDAAEALRRLAPDESSTESRRPVVRFELSNGWLVLDGRVKTGDLYTPLWWRGALRPQEAAAFGPNATRYVPGRSGTGLTDDLSAMAGELAAQGFAAYEHHYGLWYDRRRDDHLMVRRADGAVAPPFYEQPFARSGQGKAWDGLSKYDLERVNPWYWNRLVETSRYLEQRGMLLLNHHYFQHNILEAGAHWADCPWRPANNINATNLPEPPAYVGDKRVFMGQQFYDVSNEKLARLHRGYIRQCLAALKDGANVIHLTSEEYTGPVSFIQFWIDEIIAWQEEHDTKAMIGLSVTKDVQDAILADPQRAPHIDVIDIRYWHYDDQLRLVAPLGGRHLAPRQHMRQLRPRAASFASIVQAVREYRQAFPEKAILYNADQHGRSTRDGWAVLMGGGSLPNVRLPEDLTRQLPAMRPATRRLGVDDVWLLESDGGEHLLYMHQHPDRMPRIVDESADMVVVCWLDPKTGEIVQTDETTARGLSDLKIRTSAAWIRKP